MSLEFMPDHRPVFVYIPVVDRAIESFFKTVFRNAEVGKTVFCVATVGLTFFLAPQRALYGFGFGAASCLFLSFKNRQMNLPAYIRMTRIAPMDVVVLTASAAASATLSTWSACLGGLVGGALAVKKLFPVELSAEGKQRASRNSINLS